MNDKIIKLFLEGIDEARIQLKDLVLKKFFQEIFSTLQTTTSKAKVEYHYSDIEKFIAQAKQAIRLNLLFNPNIESNYEIYLPDLEDIYTLFKENDAKLQD